VRKSLACTLLILVLIFIPVYPIDENGDDRIVDEMRNKPITNINFHSLTEQFGDEIPVVVKFSTPLDYNILNILNSLEIEFSFGSASDSNFGDYYLLRGSPDGLDELLKAGVLDAISPQTSAEHLESPRDVSIPEIDADYVQNQLDTIGKPLTGEGLLIADLDSGVDWTHPDLWFADGPSYNWTDDGDEILENITDYIDLNGDHASTSDEMVTFIDMDQDGTFNASLDWIWTESVNLNGIPDIGEPFFVVNDTNQNDALDVNETVIRLSTPKTRYIVEKITGTLTVWERSQNFTICTHEDTDGHGTAVSGILLGGQLGHRKYVGVAPGAELMMIKVLGQPGSYLTVQEGLLWAYNYGAGVILVEIGSWTYQFLDGSSSTEVLIDWIVAQGIPVIAPSGNLGGKDKHALFNTIADSQYSVDFSIPPPGGPPAEGEYIVEDIETVYITILSINDTDFQSCNFSVTLWLAGPIQTVYLHPGIGMWNWFVEPMIIWVGGGILVESFTSISNSSTSMLAIRISGTLPQTVVAPWYSVDVTSPLPTTFHAYISDDKSSWTGGAIWKTDVSDDYEITWPSTATQAISVASYRTRDLLHSIWNGPDTLYDIAGFSSRGPRIDESPKLSISAPGGYDIISDYTNASVWESWFNAEDLLDFTRKFGGYRLFSGTSASGPHVAGAAALLLQYDPTSGSQMMDIITRTSNNDAFTGNVPNNIWGYGKLNVTAAYEDILLDTSGPTFGIPITDPAVPFDRFIVLVNITVNDPSGIDTVLLSFMNTTGWFNTSTLYIVSDDVYIGIIPDHPAGTVIHYKFFANDTLGNSNYSDEYNYTVAALVTSTTPSGTTSTSTPSETTPSGTTTTTVITTTAPSTLPHTSTSSTSSTTETLTTGTISEGPDYLLLAALLMIVLSIIILAVCVNRRRS